MVETCQPVQEHRKREREREGVLHAHLPPHASLPPVHHWDDGTIPGIGQSRPRGTDSSKRKTACAAGGKKHARRPSLQRHCRYSCSPLLVSRGDGRRTAHADTTWSWSGRTLSGSPPCSPSLTGGVVLIGSEWIHGGDAVNKSKWLL